MTNEEVTAFVLAVCVREYALETGMEAGDMGDGFPVDEWHDFYVRALELAPGFIDSYPDLEHCVHKMRQRMIPCDL